MSEKYGAKRTDERRCQGRQFGSGSIHHQPVENDNLSSTGKGRTGPPVLPFPATRPELLRDSVASIIKHFLDLVERHFVWVVVDIDAFHRDIHLDGIDALYLAQCALDGVLAVFTRNVGCNKCC